MCLFLLLHIFICLLSHNSVHSVLEQCIEEIFGFIPCWIMETLPKPIVWCNQWSWVNFVPFPDDMSSEDMSLSEDKSKLGTGDGMEEEFGVGLRDGGLGVGGRVEIGVLLPGDGNEERMGG